MPSVGIVGKKGREMTRAFLRLSQGTANCYHITDKQRLGPKVDVLIASEASPVLSTIVPTLSKNDYLIVNADEKEIFPFLAGSSAQLITYGFNTRANITASSVYEDGLHVCIQRGFLGIDGAEREPQEFAARVGKYDESDLVLGAAAAWAVMF